MTPSPTGERFAALVHELQELCCARVEALDGAGRFGRDAWSRPGGGGGITRVLAEGALIERGGVNVSVVHGTLSPRLLERLGGGSPEFYAAGLSIVLHPLSPMIPTVHVNVRYFEKGDGDAWFGGGADLTPYYLFEDDARHFHRVLREPCEAFEAGAYAAFKQECDTYFHIRHRKEARGVGGVFWDYLRGEPERLLRLAEGVGRAALPGAWIPIAERRRGEPWGPDERAWQCLRRGRYVEFNLVLDRGTLFGLETEGRVESILVSMPPWARWEYAHEPQAGSREAALLEVLRQPREWIADGA